MTDDTVKTRTMTDDTGKILLLTLILRRRRRKRRYLWNTLTISISGVRYFYQKRTAW